MALLIEYKCEQTISSIYSVKHKNLKHIRMLIIKACKIYKYTCERDKHHKHGRFVSRFEHTCSTSSLSPL